MFESQRLRVRIDWVDADDLKIGEALEKVLENLM